MRPQVTTYLRPKTVQWLTSYAKHLRLPRTDIIRALIERERRVGGLKRARLERLKLSGGARPQITTYLELSTKKWLIRYAEQLDFPRSDIVRAVIEREQQLQWLEWAFDTRVRRSFAKDS